MMLDILTVVAFLLLVALAIWFSTRWSRWRGTIGDDGASDVSAGTFTGTLATPRKDGLPSIVTPPDELTRDMRRAGYYHPDAAVEFNSMRYFLTLVALVVMSIFLVVVGPDQPTLFWPILWWGVGIAAAAYALPWLYVRMRGRDRVARIQRSLPDAVDMLTMGLTGGLSMHDGIAHISREMVGPHPDLATEMEIVRRHTELSGLGSAFQQFSARIDCPEVASLSAIINQSERLGSNVTTAIREYADGVRTKLRQTADERASKAGIQMLFPLVLCLAPAAMIILWGPAALELRNFFRGFAAVENQQVTRASQ